MMTREQAKDLAGKHLFKDKPLPDGGPAPWIIDAILEAYALGTAASDREWYGQLYAADQEVARLHEQLDAQLTDKPQK